MRIIGFMTACALLIYTSPSVGHSYYTGLHDKFQHYCCSGDGPNPDCEPTRAEEESGGYRFYFKNEKWVHVPNSYITFLPVPGDKIPGDAHLCARYLNPGESTEYYQGRIFDNVLVYCAFVAPPGL